MPMRIPPMGPMFMEFKAPMLAREPMFARVPMLGMFIPMLGMFIPMPTPMPGLKNGGMPMPIMLAPIMLGRPMAWKLPIWPMWPMWPMPAMLPWFWF